MRCSFREFESISASHRKEILQRGYIAVEQLFYTSGWFRSLLRMVRQQQWHGWRTYWKASSPQGRKVFLKVTFGIDWRVSGDSFVEAENEVMLYSYFSPHISAIPNISMPELIESWNSAEAFFTVISWQDCRKSSLQELLSCPRSAETLRALLQRLHRLLPPNGWDSSREPHNFACSNYGDPNHRFAAPFDIDLCQNLGVDSSGGLVFFDFEKYQWVPAGLQETVLVQYLLSIIPTDQWPMWKEAISLIGHVAIADRASVVEQGWRIIDHHRESWNIPDIEDPIRSKIAEKLLNAPES